MKVECRLYNFQLPSAVEDILLTIEKKYDSGRVPKEKNSSIENFFFSIYCSSKTRNESEMRIVFFYRSRVPI